MMAEDTFEQLSVPASLFGRSAAFLKEGSSLLLLFADEKVISGAHPWLRALMCASHMLCLAASCRSYNVWGPALHQARMQAGQWWHLLLSPCCFDHLCSSCLTRRCSTSSSCWGCAAVGTGSVVQTDQRAAGEAPAQQTLLVKHAGVHTRGNTASSGGKTIQLETGAKIEAPTYVKEGDAVLVDTASGTFVKRVIS